MKRAKRHGPGFAFGRSRPNHRPTFEGGSSGYERPQSVRLWYRGFGKAPENQPLLVRRNSASDTSRLEDSQNWSGLASTGIKASRLE